MGEGELSTLPPAMFSMKKAPPPRLLLFPLALTATNFLSRMLSSPVRTNGNCSFTQKQGMVRCGSLPIANISDLVWPEGLLTGKESWEHLLQLMRSVLNFCFLFIAGI